MAVLLVDVGLSSPPAVRPVTHARLRLHLIQRDRLIEALGRRVTCRHERKLLPCAEVHHHARDEHLSRLRAVGNARGELDRRAEEVVVLDDWLTGVDAYADAYLAALELPLDRERGFDG